MEPCFLCGASAVNPLWRWKGEHYLSSIGRLDLNVGFSMCKECGLARQDPPLPDGIVKRLYTELNLEAEFTDFDERYTWLCRALGREPDPGVLLDVGCSEGKQAQVYLSRSWQAVGIETSPDAAERAASRGIKVLQSPVEDVELEDERFDLIVFFHLLEHLTAPRAFLQRMTDSLRPGGYLYFEVPNLEKPWGNLINFFPSFHRYIFAPAHVERLLAKLPVHVIRGEDAVNQRWLVRKTGNPADPTARRPAPLEQIAQAAAFQSLSTNIGARLASALEASNEDDCAAQLHRELSPPMCAYIENRIPPLADWHRQWKAGLQAQPVDSLLQLIAMLFQNLDLFHLLKSGGMKVLSEPSLFHWGRAVKFMDFYREDVERLVGGFDPSSLNDVSERIQTVTASLERAVRTR